MKRKHWIFLLLTLLLLGYAGQWTFKRYNLNPAYTVGQPLDSLHGVVVWGVGVLAAGLISTLIIGGATTAAESADRGGLVASVATAADAELDQAATRERTDNPEAADETFTERRAEVARKLTVLSAFMTAASLLVGAVAAFFAAGSGGSHRDKGSHAKFFVLRRQARGAVIGPAGPPG